MIFAILKMGVSILWDRQIHQFKISSFIHSQKQDLQARNLRSRKVDVQKDEVALGCMILNKMARLGIHLRPSMNPN